MNIAAIPESEFEAAIERDRPPGTTMLAQWNRINRPEHVPPNALADILRRSRAGSAVKDLLEFEANARECGVEAVIEILLAPDNTDKLECVRRGLAEAIRLKGALDQAGLPGNPILKLVHGKETED